MAKLMDVKMSVLDNDTVIVSAHTDDPSARPKTYGFAGWPEALEFVRAQTAPPISLEEVRQLIANAEASTAPRPGDSCPG